MFPSDHRLLPSVISVDDDVVFGVLPSTSTRISAVQHTTDNSKAETEHRL